jgi:opacity protein-like surface antigen
LTFFKGRRNMKKFFAFLLITFLTYNTAYATNNFEGAYAGASIGYLGANHSSQETVRGSPPSWWVENIKPQNIIYGGYVGLNKVNDNFLYGIEAELDNLNASGENNGHFADGIDAGYPIKTKYRHAMSLKGRLGYIFNENSTLVYTSVGGTIAKLNTKFYNESGSAAVDDYTRNIRGWTVGLGVEQFISDQLSIKTEYRHTRFKKLIFTNTTYSGCTDPACDDTINARNNSFRLGFTYYFK